ncbi:SWI/SNF-related matrix-associated actin-dependent regulator of chromatin subfamily A containing DEAD/H box 1A-like [Lytechinus variegatus]|uniref:SWI/SNF-related matrix-associated actin-dependent regulator of chromatin subfamily A containing DEAD/H box 1A-like n=1 Tax=Lytechinus variegatus TaxID=7654 RepID=UPI001BB27607|nr:SWI/SNF-related matrix-associated actin-dependent regulator of chromatin subfamily A containing DEAD/H box 1A-like [Lytechinus variegatus]
MYIMASGRVSSLLNRFKFEQRSSKKLTASSSGPEKTSSSVKHCGMNGDATQSSASSLQSRSSTPDSDAILCIPETPTSDLPESIESGSPVFPSAKKRLAENSQRSLVTPAISSLLSPSTSVAKSPTFGKQSHAANGKQSSPSSSHRTKNKQLRFVDESESESDNEPISHRRESSSHSPNSHRDMKTNAGCETESDSTHIDTQSSLETVLYSYEEQGSLRPGGLKRKLSEMSSGGEVGDGDEDEKDDKMKKDIMEQLKVCFPHKEQKELKRALKATDWNINQAANDLMQVGSPPRCKRCTSPTIEPKKPSLIKKSNFQDAFSGWLQKPSTGQRKKNWPQQKKVPRKVISSSDDDTDDDVEVLQKSKESNQKKTFKRIRTFSSDSMEDASPVKKTEGKSLDTGKNRDNQSDQESVSSSKKGEGDQEILTDSDENEDDDKKSKGNGRAGNTSGKIANGFYKKGAPTQNGVAGKKPFRKVWAGFLSRDSSSAAKSSGKKQRTKTASKATSIKPIKRPRSPRYSDEEEDDLRYGDSGSEYELEEEVSPEFQAMAVTFFNDATLEELISVDGCSKGKAEKIISIRPFEDFSDLLEKFDGVKQLNANLVWNSEAVFQERKVVEDVMARCIKISERIQRKVTSVIENPDSAVNGQLTRQPALLNRSMQLKPYQLVGLNWLKLMHSEQVNGILADEMGLGKTIQVIALLSHLLEEGTKGPHLIVAPSSTVDNWVRELQTWCPALEVVLYHGSQEDRQEIREDLLYEDLPCNVIVTSYNICASSAEDRAVFKKLPLHYAIFDEGHMLKNMKSQRYNHLMKIRAEKRLLLTGTPLQNNLQELISVLAFTLPKMFSGKANDLTRVFSMKKQKTGNPHEQSSYEMERIAHAKQIMQPFVLRRIKADVLSQLPKKKESIEHVEMTADQREGYTKLVASISKDLKVCGFKRGKMSSAMMELRKQANHPLLLRRHYDNEKIRKMAKLMLEEPTHYDANEEYIYEDMEVMSDYELHRLCHEYGVLREYRLDQELVLQSGKFQLLDKMLAELKEQGSRVLLFSQFVMVLDIVEEYLNIRGHRFVRMDGQTPVQDRAELMDKFNEDESVFIFMLSTKAGGVGINLTAANTVILHDIDFNPYNDKQAEDRCHRVGQRREVSVIRLVSKQSIEEGMLSCANYKLKLEKQMTRGFSGEDGKEDEKDIASLLRDALDI